MEKGSKNKMMDGTEAKNKTEQSPPEPQEQEWHFSGGLEYEPITVRAKSREEAEAIWLQTRKKVEKINNQ